MNKLEQNNQNDTTKIMHSTLLTAELSLNKHNWVCKKDGKLLIRGSWANRLQCNGCGDWCFVHRVSDGRYYCSECRNTLINQELAIGW